MALSAGGVLSGFFFLSFCAAAGEMQVKHSAVAAKNKIALCIVRTTKRVARCFFIRVSPLG
jgi:hypothetical protein